MAVITINRDGGPYPAVDLDFETEESVCIRLDSSPAT